VSVILHFIHQDMTSYFKDARSVSLYTYIYISPDKARKGVIYPLKTGIYALVGISERTFTR